MILNLAWHIPKEIKLYLKQNKFRGKIINIIEQKILFNKLLNTNLIMKNHLNSFYKKKRILITGNSGFKGSWLTIILKEFGANVMGISIGQVSKPNMFNLLKLDKDIIYLKEDIRNYKK